MRFYSHIYDQVGYQADLEHVVELLQQEPLAEKLASPAVSLRYEEEPVYTDRSGYVCPEIDETKRQSDDLFEAVCRGFVSSVYTRLFKVSHSGKGIHPIALVEAQGSFDRDYDLAEGWSGLLAGGLAPDKALRAPKQKLLVSPTPDYMYRSDSLPLTGYDIWVNAYKSLQALNPDLEPDCYEAARIYKGLPDAEEARFAGFLAFCMRSSEYSSREWCLDKFKRAHELSFGGAPGDGTRSMRAAAAVADILRYNICLLYTSPSPRDRTRSRMPSSA